MSEFSPLRLKIARCRRQMKKKDLAASVGISTVHMSRINSGYAPSDDTVRYLAKALRYPVDFFYADDVEVLKKDDVSFRSLSGMAAFERDAAIAAGCLGLVISDWADATFSLPAPDLPDLRDMSPAVAATWLRQEWLLGEKPVKNLLKLLEAKGVRVFSLSENTRNVDAFSFWRSDRPYMYLNTKKTAEHSIFDAAHELGHLVLHRHSRGGGSRDLEVEANAFAAEFLMPERDVLANLPRKINQLRAIVYAKSRWRVSAAALLRRANTLGRLSDWHYRHLTIELSMAGYRTSEPRGIERESSVVWTKIFRELWKERITKADIAKELSIPLDELEGLVFGLLKQPQQEVVKAGTGLSAVG